MNAPRLNLTVSDLPLNGESVSLIVHSLARECHEAALASGIFSHSVEGQLHLVLGILNRDMGDLINCIDVPATDASCIAGIRFAFSDEGYLSLASAAKDRAILALDVDANVVGAGHE